ncbi:MAG: hypothetical protein H0U33_05385 [Solirubrobacterales bacterium]|jgi:hypothetical protein|nr:hypothetical protein [Solirubrobacterales bacterium]
MIYCVVPTALADELYDKLVAHYADDPDVEVIVDRRTAERRSDEATPAEREQRTTRDRRRRRVPGEFPPIAEGD